MRPGGLRRRALQLLTGKPTSQHAGCVLAMGCGMMAASVAQVLTVELLPKVLVLKLKLKTYDPANNVNVFQKKKISLQEHIDLRAYVSTRDGATSSYKLYGVISHQRPSEHTIGHYLSYVLLDDKWFRCDDQYIREATLGPDSAIAVSEGETSEYADTLLYRLDPLPVSGSGLSRKGGEAGKAVATRQAEKVRKTEQDVVLVSSRGMCIRSWSLEAEAHPNLSPNPNPNPHPNPNPDPNPDPNPNPNAAGNPDGWSTGSQLTKADVARLRDGEWVNDEVRAVPLVPGSL